MIKEEAIEILSDMRAEYNIFSGDEEATRYHALSWAIQALNERTGRWIDDELMCKARCSVCGEEFSWMDNDMDRFLYCPNCGAKMEETDERT